MVPVVVQRPHKPTYFRLFGPSIPPGFIPFEQLWRMRRLYDPERLRAEPDRTRDQLGCCRRYEPTACGDTPRG